MQNYALVIWIGEGEQINSDPGFDLDVHKYVFYPGEILAEDCFEYAKFEKEVQEGKNVSERLFNGVRRMFDYRFEKVVLINSLGIQLPQQVIKDAFEALSTKDIVLLPSGANNLKLLGLRKPLLRLFKESVWQSDEMILDLLLLMQARGMDYRILDEV